MTVRSQSGPTNPDLSIRSAGRRDPVHPDIDEESIKCLVETFYGRVRQHERLGEIFERRLEGKWPAHLEKMQAFWQSVLLKNGVYKGKPVPAHLKQKELVSSDFAEWLRVFRPVAHEVFAEQPADLVIQVAERIAESLWLAAFGTAETSPPQELSPAAR